MHGRTHTAWSDARPWLWDEGRTTLRRPTLLTLTRTARASPGLVEVVMRGTITAQTQFNTPASQASAQQARCMQAPHILHFYYPQKRTRPPLCDIAILAMAAAACAAVKTHLIGSRLLNGAHRNKGEERERQIHIADGFMMRSVHDRPPSTTVGLNECFRRRQIRIRVTQDDHCRDEGAHARLLSQRHLCSC